MLPTYAKAREMTGAIDLQGSFDWHLKSMGTIFYED